MFTDEEKKKIRVIQNEYHKNWRKKNPQKIKAINERYWKKKLAERSKK